MASTSLVLSAPENIAKSAILPKKLNPAIAPFMVVLQPTASRFERASRARNMPAGMGAVETTVPFTNIVSIRCD
jgi:hypothetical protein